jgi:Ca-activated chloride channel family protein
VIVFMIFMAFMVNQFFGATGNPLARLECTPAARVVGVSCWYTMRRLVTLLACAVAAGAAAGGQTQVFRSAAETVPVHVTVLDKSGRLVTGLARDNFEVRDNGRVQPITVFDSSPQPMRLIIMLDVSGSMSGNVALLRTATREVISRMETDDLVRIGTFGNDISFSPRFSSDASELLAALPETIPPDAGTPLWSGLDRAMTEFHGIDGRRVILLLSDGRDTGPVKWERDTHLSSAEVLDRAQRQGFMFYVVAMESRGATQTPIPGGSLGEHLVANRPDPGLSRLARESGGGYFQIGPRDDLAAAFARVVDELRRQYLLGYKPPQLDGRMHAIDVAVKKPDMEARARKQYLAPSR